MMKIYKDDTKCQLYWLRCVYVAVKPWLGRWRTLNEFWVLNHLLKSERCTTFIDVRLEHRPSWDPGNSTNIFRYQKLCFLFFALHCGWSDALLIETGRSYETPHEWNAPRKWKIKTNSPTGRGKQPPIEIKYQSWRSNTDWQVTIFEACDKIRDTLAMRAPDRATKFSLRSRM